MTHSTDEYRISGVVLHPASGQPAGGLLIRAFDRDFFRAQPLGEGVSDDGGRYEIRFGRDAFTGPLIRLERSPDVFLRVFDPEGRLVHSTERSVVVNAGRDARIDLRVPGGAPAEPPRLSIVGGERVDRAAVAELRTDELAALYLWSRGRGPAPARLELARRAFPDHFATLEARPDCGVGIGEGLVAVLREREGFDEAFDEFPPDVTIHSFFTDSFVVNYTTDAASIHHLHDPSLPAADQSFANADGVEIGTVRATLAALHPDNTEVAPTVVQQVGLIAEWARQRYLAPPFSFRDPLAGMPRLEIRMLEQGGSLGFGPYGKTSIAGKHVEVDPQNDLQQNLATVPHELFHRVQWEYNAWGNQIGQISSAFMEGGARLMEDCLEDAPNRYASSGEVILTNPDLPLVRTPGVSTFESYYGYGLFWKYIAEQHGVNTGPADEPAIGVDTYRILLQETATSLPGDPGLGYTFEAYRNARAKMPWPGRFDQFYWHDDAHTELSSHETTWGNFVVANYLHGTASPTPDARFDYREDDEVFPSKFGDPLELSQWRAAVKPGDVETLAQGGSSSRGGMLHPYASRYFRVVPDAASAPRLLRVRFTAVAGMEDPLVQVLRLGPGDALVDLHRSDAPAYDKTVSFDGLQAVVVIVTTRESGGSFTLQLDEVASATDVTATRWNTAAGTEYEVDGRAWGWTWVSPDVMVDTDGDGLADPQVFLDEPNVLKLRLRNRGNADATGIGVEFWYQKATAALSPDAWIPVGDAVSGETLAAGATKWVSVQWTPMDDGSGHKHWCVKARITVPGDANSDNKVVLSNFFNVVPGGGAADTDTADFAQLFRHAGAGGDEVHVISRGTRWTLEAAGAARGEPFRAGKARRVSRCRCAAAGPSPERLALQPFRARARQQAAARWDGRERAAAPRPDVAYPVHPATLPPGVDPESLVTLAHVVNGEAVGGVTCRILDR